MASTKRDTQWDVLINGIAVGTVFDVNVVSVAPGFLMPIRATQSALDSTLVALGAGGIYPGPFVACDQFSAIIGALTSDVAGTLRVQQSSDGVALDAEEPIVYPGGNLAMGYQVPVVMPFARIEYVNGPFAQLTFRLFMRGRTT